ncbi:MAG: hypothetical protein KF718_01400 [Polyangiaceae bacterium]|nr:hypothetical protein [Polyangiaceae bacterium]
MSLSVEKLTPRRLHALLGPEWRLDHAVVGDYRLRDIHPHETRGALTVELADEQRRLLRLEVGPAGAGPSSASGAGLEVSWVPPSERHAGTAACAALAASLARSGAGAVRRWATTEATDADLLEEVLAESRVEAASLQSDPDHRLLAADAKNFELLYAARPTARRVLAAPGLSIHYPAPVSRLVPPSGAVYPLPHRLHRRRVFRSYFAALGFGFTAGFARTVPTPHTYDRSRGRRSGAAPLRFAMHRGRGGSVSARAWVTSLVEQDAFPVLLAPRWSVMAHYVLRRSRLFSLNPVDVGMLSHDMATHGMAYHAIPAGIWSLLSERARRLLRRGGPEAPAAVADFFEGAVTRSCWEVWRTLDSPDAFAHGLESKVAGLERALVELGARGSARRSSTVSIL